jgi:uncharacterized protein with NRDE domain
VQNFLTGQLGPHDIERRRYAGFNLLLGTGSQLTYISSQDPPRPLSPGTYALGNDTLDRPSPRVLRALALFQSCTASDPAAWLDLFTDPMVWIDLPGYGTRCTTLVQDDQVYERTRGQTEILQRTWP